MKQSRSFRTFILMLNVCLILPFLAGCQNENKVPEEARFDPEEKIFYEGRDLILNLDVSDGTGFDWQVLYQPKGVELISSEYHVSREDPKSVGGKGKRRMEFNVKTDEDTVLVLQNRRGEEETAAFSSYNIHMGNGNIAAVEEQVENIGIDWKSHTESFGEDSFFFRLPKDWEYERYESEDQQGIRMRASAEDSWIALVHCSFFGVCGTGLSQKTVRLNGIDYSQGTYEEDVSFSYLWNGETGLLVLNDPSKPQEHYPQILEILSLCSWNG